MMVAICSAYEGRALFEGSDNLRCEMAFGDRVVADVRDEHDHHVLVILRSREVVFGARWHRDQVSAEVLAILHILWLREETARRRVLPGGGLLLAHVTGGFGFHGVWLHTGPPRRVSGARIAPTGLLTRRKSMRLYRSSIDRVFHPHNVMISPFVKPALRSSRAAVRRRSSNRRPSRPARR